MQSEEKANAVKDQERKTKDDQERKTKDEAQQRKRRMITVQVCCRTEHKMMRLSVDQPATARDMLTHAATFLGVVET